MLEKSLIGIYFGRRNADFCVSRFTPREGNRKRFFKVLGKVSDSLPKALVETQDMASVNDGPVPVGGGYKNFHNHGKGNIIMCC